MTRIQKLWYFRTWAEQELRRRNVLEELRRRNVLEADLWCDLYLKKLLDRNLVIKFNAWFKDNAPSNSVSISEPADEADDFPRAKFKPLPTITLDTSGFRNYGDCEK